MNQSLKPCWCGGEVDLVTGGNVECRESQYHAPYACWCGGEVDLVTGGNVECRESQYHAPYATGERPIRMLYVAGPMTGYPECNYPAFKGASWQLRNAGFQVWNPAERVDSHVARHYVDLLRDDLKGLLQCEGVAILPGWEFSVGARNEVTVAGVLRMPVKPVDDWLNY